MKTPQRAGLVSAGTVGQSFLARMPALLAHLGPVVGNSYGVSRRIVNSLRHGEAQRDYSAFPKCASIWLAGPERWIDRASRELALAGALDGKVVVVCEAWRDSYWPGVLRGAGARVASLNCIPETLEKNFIAEGHPEAIRLIRAVLSIERRKLIEIEPDSKALYFAGVQFAAHLVLPWIAGGVEMLRAAGFSRLEATDLAHRLAEHALRGYCKGGVKSWNKAKARDLHGAVIRGSDEFHRRDARLAELYESGIEQARAYFEPTKGPESERRLKPPARAAVGG